MVHYIYQAKNNAYKLEEMYKLKRRMNYEQTVT